MSSLAAETAKTFRRLIKNGTPPDEAFNRASLFKVVECFPGYNRVTRYVTVRLDSTYPMESSAVLLFSDNSVLIIDGMEAYVAKITTLTEDGIVHAYSDDLLPAEPLKRYKCYGNRQYPVRYPFTETERALVSEAIQLLDSVLIAKYGRQLPVWAKWFPKDRLLVKNLIAAGGGVEAVCSLLSQTACYLVGDHSSALSQ